MKKSKQKIDQQQKLRKAVRILTSVLKEEAEVEAELQDAVYKDERGRLYFTTNSWELLRLAGGDFVKQGCTVTYQQVFGGEDGTLYEVFISVKPKAVRQ
jgi:hypothetical protein